MVSYINFLNGGIAPALKIEEAYKNRDRGAYAPLPHHRTCGSASGGSVKCDEVGIVLGNFLVRTVANKRCSRRDEPVVIWIAARVPNLFLQRERPSILRPLSLSGFRSGSVASAIASTQFVASASAAMRPSSPYVFGHQPSYSSSPIQ